MVLCFALFPAPGPAQVAEKQELKSGDLSGTLEKKEAFGIRNGSTILAPVPFSNPMIGTGLALGAGYLFRTGPESKTSVLGLGGMRSDNGSQAAGLVANLAFDNNRWLFESFVGEALINYDLYVPGGIVPISQDGVLGRFKLAYGVTEDLSFGGSLRYLNSSISPDLGFALPPELLDELNLEIMSLGITGEWDTRDETDYPERGFRLSGEAVKATVIGGSYPDYQTANLKFDFYYPPFESGVVALRAVICGVSTDTPFFDQCSLGATDGFRGFNATQFLDLRSTSFQAEYRQRFSPRWGAVAFGGIGWTGPTFGQLDAGGSHAAIGLGIRYRVSKKFPVDFSVDASHADDGSNQLYIYVGQRF